MQGALHGVANLLRSVAPLFLMADPRDIGVLAETKSTFTLKPTIFIYDRVPAGIGFSEQLYRIDRELLKAALELVRSCPCEVGCPSCVGPVSETGGSAKGNASRLLEEMLAFSAGEGESSVN
jgi:DEAD/DEAH box helicase domain-containing protein